MKRVVSCRVSDPYADPCLGSSVSKCSMCGEEVWVAPASVKMLAEDLTAQLLCIQCAVPYIREMEGPPQPVSAVEVLDHLLRKRQ